MSVFDAIEKMLNEMESMFYPPRGRITVIPIVLRANVSRKTEGELKAYAPKKRKEDKEECSCSPAEDTQSLYKDPVFGVFHSVDYVDSVKLNINGHTVYADVDDVKNLYTKIGPALRKYKREHTDDE